MPYTNAYDITAPPGTELAKNIDDRMRVMRTDVKERIDSILKAGTTIDDQPLVLAEMYSGNVVDKKMLIGFPAFSASSIGKEYYYDDDKLIAFTDTDVLVAPLILPIGVIVTQVRLLADRHDAGTVQWKVKSRPFGAGATATIETVTHSAAGLVISNTVTNPLINGVSNAVIYWLAIEGTGTAGNSFYIYGAEVTYTTPDTRNTL